MGSAEVQDEKVVKPAGFFGMRHMVVFMLFLATTVSYSTRVSMSVAIVAMTNHDDPNHEIFEWDRATQDTILSSFFWGYIILQIPAGLVVAKFGGKTITTVAMFFTGVFNLFMPVAASKGGWIAVIVCRVLIGLMQGPIYPSIHGLLGQWAPVTERSRMGTFVYAGSQLGTIIEMVLAGVLAESRWGWPSIFYVSGVTCIAWAILWVLFGASSPSTSRWISKEERKYIETTNGSFDVTDNKSLPTPWKKIWTSLPFWAILLAHSGQSLGFWTLLTEIPTYMSHVLGVNIKSSGMLSALPYAAMYILSFVFSWTADSLVNRNVLSLQITRKIFNTIAFWGPAAALLALSYLPPGNLTLSVVILTITVGLNGAHYVGFLISHIDIAPNFASTLMGITNGVGNIFSIMAPLSVTAVVTDESSATEWRNVFFISIAFYFLSNLFFLLFMSGDIQKWNEPVSTTTPNTIEEGSKPKVQKRPRRRSSLAEQMF